ncbi:MAG TPA: hypothetical protein PLP01_16020 [Phycisphaerae bacterium]|nr:hypothetical protein [Phycisphaerae bacterium]
MGNKVRRILRTFATEDQDPLAPETVPWGMLINRLLSALVAAAYIIAALADGAGPAALRLLAFLIPVVLLIWYSDELGGLMMHWNVQITSPSPGWMVRLFAWILLLMPAFVALMYAVYQ